MMKVVENKGEGKRESKREIICTGNKEGRQMYAHA